MVIWVHATEAVTWTVTGTQPAETAIPLYTGWNLVGYPSRTNQPIETALNEIATVLTEVRAYDASDGADLWKTYVPGAVDNDLTEMAPGRGYWVQVTADTTFTVRSVLPTVEWCGAITEGETWEGGYVHLLTCDVTVSSGVTLTVEAGAKCTLHDPGASGWITVQGSGRIGNLALQTPAMIRFGQETDDEVFITHEAARKGVEVENTGQEPLVSLRYFGPDTFDDVPNVGDYRKAS